MQIQTRLGESSDAMTTLLKQNSHMRRQENAFTEITQSNVAIISQPRHQHKFVVLCHYTFIDFKKHESKLNAAR